MLSLPWIRAALGLYVADAADWIIVASAAGAAAPKTMAALSAARPLAQTGTGSANTLTSGVCGSARCHTHTLSNKYGKVFLHLCNINLLFLVDGNYTVSSCW